MVRRVIGVIASSLTLLTAHVTLSATPPASAAAAACPTTNTCVTVVLDNQNAGVPAKGNTLYVTLVDGGQPATLVQPSGTTFAVGQSVKYSDLRAADGSYRRCMSQDRVRRS